MKISAEKTGLFWGTILLLGSNIIVKGLGFFYRVILVRLLGVEGVGLIEMAAPIYSFLLVLAAAFRPLFPKSLPLSMGRKEKLILKQHW